MTGLGGVLICRQDRCFAATRRHTRVPGCFCETSKAHQRHQIPTCIWPYAASKLDTLHNTIHDEDGLIFFHPSHAPRCCHADNTTRSEVQRAAVSTTLKCIRVKFNFRSNCQTHTEQHPPHPHAQHPTVGMPTTTSPSHTRITTRRLLTCLCCGPLVLAMVPWPQHHITRLTASLDQGVNGTTQHAVRSWQAPHNCKQHHAPHNHLTHPTPHMHTHCNLAMPRKLCSQRDPSLSPAAALGPRPCCHGPRVTRLIASTRRPWCAFTCASTKERKERGNSVIVLNTPRVMDYQLRLNKVLMTKLRIGRT